MERGCKTCGVSIAHKKSNAKYCSPICKTNYWLYGENYEKVKNAEEGEIRKSDFLVSRKKHKPKVKRELSLKGVIEDQPQNENKIPPEIENPDYSKLNKIRFNFERLLKQEKERLTNVKNHLDKLLKELPMLISTGTGTLIGGCVNSLTKNNKQSSFSIGGAFLGGLIGTGVGYFRKKKIKVEIQQIQDKIIPKINKRVQYYTQKLNRTNTFLLRIPKLITNPLYLELTNKKRLSITLPKADINQSRDVVVDEIETNEKIICSNDLKVMKFRSFDFKDNWQELLGNPSVNFKMAVHGKPGQGKSTFCLQFANYLAKNFGRVLYVSGEEGVSKTMKDKLQNNKAFNNNLFIADIHSSEDLIETVPQNAYHFIIIDSLNNMGIDEQTLLNIEEHYNNCAMISIAQSTKKGEMRGSQEILHNVDIVLKVENGFAECTKNRFAPIGFEFPIF